jgi:hypothetical protein
VGKPEEKRPLGRPRRRWMDSVKLGLGEIGWDGMDWIGLTRNMDDWTALVNTVMNLLVPKIIWKFFSSCIIGNFSGRAQLHEVSLFVRYGRHTTHNVMSLEPIMCYIINRLNRNNHLLTYLRS